jgi:hypothetical protein
VARTGVRNKTSLNLITSALVSMSGFVLFVLEQNMAGYGLLAASLLLAGFIDRALLRDLGLIAAGLVAISLVPITTDISTEHMFVMGSAMTLAVGIA